MKFFITDLDGTFLNGAHLSNKLNIEAIDKVLEHDKYFAICTGRHLHRNHQVGLNFLHKKIFKIVMNGALIKDTQDNIIFEHSIDEKFIHQLEKEFPDVPFEWITKSGVYVNRTRFEQFKSVLSRGMKLKQLIKQLVMLFVAKDIYYNAKRTDPILYIGARVGDNHMATKLSEYLLEHKAYVINYGPNLNHFEIVAKGVNKREASIWLANYLNVQEDDVAVYGNDLNDVPMLAHFKHSYAPSNSVDKAKENAGFIIESNAKNGVSKHIISLINQETNDKK